MKTDRELLELAAKAAGIDGWWESGYLSFIKSTGGPWNPLTDDGDALRLAVKLGIQINGAANSASSNGIYWFAQSGERDPNAATRRAIVRAAASIGESL